MALLNKEELEAEIEAVKNVLNTHKKMIELNETGVRANSFILELLEREHKKIYKD